MVRDAYLPPRLAFLIKFVEPELDAEEIAAEAQYLHEDLQALTGLAQTRFSFLHDSRGERRFRAGVRFEVSPDRLRTILRRLCDRLDDRPLETLVLIQQGAVKLQLQTHQSEELAGIVLAAEALLPPERIYLAKAETYSRTRGELSPAEEANLDLLRQRLVLSKEEAEELKAQAMGPFKTLAEKRRHFEEVLVGELAREFPLSDNTWVVLRELAENLGLPLDQATAIYQGHLYKIQAEATAIRQQAEAKAATNSEKETQLESPQTENDRQQQFDQYRETFRQTIQTHLYPLAYDQGRLEQARLLLEISPVEANQIEETVRGELYGQIQSALGIDYTRLRQLLWDRDWQEADQETENVMLKALDKNLQPLDLETILKLPCADLVTIDQLWSRYSEGQFGFKAQQRIYQQVERRPLEFSRALGWRGNPLGPNRGLVPYKDFQFSLSAPPGHLPTWRWCCPSLDSGYEVSDALVDKLFVLLGKCLPLETATVPLGDSAPGQGG